MMFWYDLREGRRFIVSVFVLFVSLLLLGVAVLAIWYAFFNPAKESLRADGQYRPAIPLNMYAAATVETFDCLADGEDACPEYESSKQFVADTTTTLTYTSTDRDDPGKANEDGTRTVTTADLSSAELRAVASAALADGRATVGDVAGDDAVTMTPDGTCTFTVPAREGDPETTFTLRFAHTGPVSDPASVRLTSMTYREGGR